MDCPHRMGQPIGVSIGACVLFAAVAALPAACDSQQDQNAGSEPSVPATASQPENETPFQTTGILDRSKREGISRLLPNATSEPTREVRVIAKGKLAVPAIPEEGLTRVSPSETAAEKNARQIARKPKKLEPFPRPLVISAGEIRSGETTIHLAGIDALPKEKTCQTSQGDWPCGNYARAALQRLIRARTIRCTEANKSGKETTRACTIGETDLSRWLVTQGWATAATPALHKAEHEAREAQRGIWRTKKPSF